jgi:dynein heavy chain 1, cytosolic
VRRDIEVAGDKLRSAEQMMESLEDEWDRWMAELTVYNDTAEFVWGNAVLGAAFVSYAGALDVVARRSLLDKWRLILNQGNIEVEENLSMAEYLTSLKERSAWSQKGLPMDETSVQSYAILKRSARYPLIIDPSRKMESVIRAVVLAARPPVSQEKQSHSTLNDGHVLDKVVLSKTSFASSGKQSYLRVIESAMRFGTAVLVEDAEQFDHSIAPVLGQEATTGDIGDAASQESGASGSCRDATLSHRLVRLGDRDVDQNPSFRLFLSATDLIATPSAAVSRCCVVSFTFSEANLLARCVSRALHFITPDLEAKRSELAAAKLAYEKRKAVLEEGLLAAIAEASDDSSSLLEGSLLTTLQTLKVETKDNEAQMSLRKAVADEVDFATLKYDPIAGFAVRIFFALSRLSQLNPLYRFSADYFVELLDTCIESACAQYGGKEEAILSRVFDDLAATVFTHVSPSLFPEDQAPFAAVLCIVAATDEVEQKEIDLMLKAFVQTRSSASASKVADGDFTGPSSALLVLVSKVLDASVSNPAAIRAALNNLASRLQHNGEPAIYSPVSKSENILQNEIQDFAAMQSSSSPTKIFFRPLLLCTRGAGVDPSSLVSHYCRTAGVACESLAVGDGESVSLTRLALDFASQKWHRSSDRRGLLLVKNLHLAPVECAELLRREIVKHQGCLPYLVVIAGEVGRCSPDTVTSNLASLSADCRVLAFEAPCDFRSTLTRSLSIARPSGEVVDFETSGLLTAVGWLHAAIIERCRYAPTGISKRYEFSEADLVAARDAVLSLFGQGRSKPYPDVLARLVADSIYGGRVESTLDNNVLEEMIKDLFANVVAHRSNQCIRVVHGASEGRHVDLPADAVEVAKAVGALPVAAPATWFGLDSTAESEKEGRVGTASLDTVLKMYMLATCR